MFSTDTADTDWIIVSFFVFSKVVEYPNFNSKGRNFEEAFQLELDILERNRV